MNEFIQQFPVVILAWGALFGLAVLGGLAIWGAIFRSKAPMEKEIKGRTASLIQTLRQQVDALEKKVNDQEQLLKETKIQLEQLITENKAFREIFEGRDGATQAYQSDGRKAFLVANQVLDTVTRIDTNIQGMLKQEVVETTTKKIKRL